MKVPGSDGSGEALKRVQEGRSSESSVHRRGVLERPVGGGSGSPVDGSVKTQVDTVTLSSLGAVLRQELDPSKMAEERKARIASLKEQIQNGTYAPPLEGVAQAISEEISLEVLLGGNVLQEGDDR